MGSQLTQLLRAAMQKQCLRPAEQSKHQFSVDVSWSDLKLTPTEMNDKCQIRTPTVRGGGGVKYELMLGNFRPTECDAIVYNEHTEMGSYRIGPHSTFKVQRPSNFKKHFVVVRSGSAEAKKAGVVQNGLDGSLRVVFRPRKSRLPCVVKQKCFSLGGDNPFERPVSRGIQQERASDEECSDDIADADDGPPRQKGKANGRGKKDKEEGKSDGVSGPSKIVSASLLLDGECNQSFGDPVPSLKDHEVDMACVTTIEFQFVVDTDYVVDISDSESVVDPEASVQAGVGPLSDSAKPVAAFKYEELPFE